MIGWRHVVTRQKPIVVPYHTFSWVECAQRYPLCIVLLEEMSSVLQHSRAKDFQLAIGDILRQLVLVRLGFMEAYQFHGLDYGKKLLHYGGHRVSISIYV